MKIYNLPSDSSEAYVQIYFPNVGDFIRADSIYHDILYTYVPFGSQSGNIKIIYVTNSLLDSFAVKNFTVTEDSPDTVKIIWSDLNYIIDGQNSVLSNVPALSKFKWSVGINQDTIKISSRRYLSEMSYYYHLNFLDKGPDQLPAFLNGVVVEGTDYGTEEYFDLTKGTIKIQDWQVGNVISGRAISEPWKHNNYPFLYTFK